MVKRRFLMGLVLCGILSAVSAHPAEKLDIHVYLFKGAWAAGQPRLKEVTILTQASHPAIAALRAKLDAPQAELTAAAIDALIEAQDLKTVEDYFAYVADWSGRRGAFSHDISHKKYGFKVSFSPKRVSPQSLELGLVLSESDASRSGKLLDRKLSLDLESPVVIGIPSGEEAFFLLVFVRGAAEAPAGKSGTTGSGSGTRPAIEPPKEIHTILPAYPEELRRQGIKGQVKLQVAIDEWGSVTEVKILTPLHPYLDFAAVQAVRQWTYEPAVQNGKRIPVIVKITMGYDPASYALFEARAREESREGGQPPAEALAGVLGGAAEYCQRLAGASLDFICEETIKEIHYNFAAEPKWGSIVAASRDTGEVTYRALFPMWDPGRTIRSDYVCDYLFVRKGAGTEERRIVLKEDGRGMPDRNRVLEEKRFTALNPVLAAIGLIGRDRQADYYYRLIGTELREGRKAFIVEAVSKSGNTWGVECAKIWIDDRSSQILRSEIQGVPLEGYDDVLADAVQFRVRPYLLTTHDYGVEKNGVRFPSRSTIRVEYPRRGDFNKDRTLKMKIDMSYGKYKFFVVETDSAVRK